MGTSVNTITLSVWPLSVSRDRLDALHALLCDEEKARARRFHSSDARQEYVVAHGIARELLGVECCCHPRDIAFKRAANGKPSIAARRHAPSFSLAHAGRYAALAACRLAPLGVDLEPIGPLSDDLVHAALSRPAAAALRLVPAALRPTAFFRAWTLKEAYLKATGEGLPGGLDSLELDIQPGAQVTPIAIKGSVAGITDWQFFAFEPAPGYAGAIALHSARRVSQPSLRVIDPETATPTINMGDT